MPEETKQRLLEAAWACVRDGGIRSATSRSIATEAGANLAAITYHFGSKDQLLAEAYVEAIRGLIEPALQVLGDDDLDPVTRMLQAVAQLQQSFNRAPGDISAYLEVLVQSHRIPLLQDGVAVLFADLRDVLAAQIVEQQAAGILPPWVQPEPMAGLLIAVAQGVVLQTSIDPDGPPQAAMVDQFTRLLVAAR